MPYIFDKQARLYDLKWYFSYLPKVWRFSKLIDRVEGGKVWLKDGWVLDTEKAELMMREQDYWGHYLWSGLKGSTVLDIGAGCGETARLFLNNGAKTVICVDNDAACCYYLRHNALTKNITVISGSFEPSMVWSFNADFIKMDIEGYEVLLIEYLKRGLIYAKDLRPMVIEAHSQYCINELLDLGFKIGFEYRPDLKILNNWID